MKTNMYFPCCRAKSVSHENLHEDEGTPGRVRRPNPLIVGLANHLREHHSSSRNSAISGCFGFPDSPPRYEDIYIESSRNGNPALRNSQRHNLPVDGGIGNPSRTKEILAEEEGIDPPPFQEDEPPPPSYEESVKESMGMSSSTCVVVTINIDKELKENFT